MGNIRLRILLGVVFLGFTFGPVFAVVLKGNSEQIRKALKDKPLDDWFYEDLAGAVKKARKENKPLLVNFR